MDYTHPTSDNKHDPYTTEFSPETSSSNYRPPPLHRSSSSESSPTLNGYPDEKNNVYTMNYNEHDSLDDPTNVRQSRTYPGHDALDAAGPSEYSRVGYSDDDIHRGYPAIEDSAEALIIRDDIQSRKKARFQDLEYADPTNVQPTDSESKGRPLVKFFEGAKYPLAQRIENKKRGIGRQKYPIVVYSLTIAMVGVLIYELILNSRQQGSPISLKPTVNPMLGPSSSALVNLGARFPPCMKLVTQVPPSTPIGCMNNTANPVNQVCTVEDLCGFGGFHDGTPNQWFRFITAIFLHAGLIHLFLNMLAQLTLSAQIEREMGSGGFLIAYFAAGIFGNVLGGNFALVGVPSVGASGAIFGTVAVTWVDLLAHWQYQYRPVRKLIFMTIELLIGIAIGYIPYVDNFAHIGGFLMGLLVGTIFYPVISVTKRHRLIMWTFRIVAIPIAVILFVVLIRNFYTSDPYAACSGCRYLSCFPTSANNHCQGIVWVKQYRNLIIGGLERIVELVFN